MHFVRGRLAEVWNPGPPGQMNTLLATGDLLLGEIGRATRDRTAYDGQLPRPWVMNKNNDGTGQFTPQLIEEGTGMHDSALLDLRNTGRLDVVIKPLHGTHIWDITAFLNEG